MPLEIRRVVIAAATTERTMILAEIYRRGDGWWLRAVGQATTMVWPTWPGGTAST